MSLSLGLYVDVSLFHVDPVAGKKGPNGLLHIDNHALYELAKGVSRERG